MPKDPEIFQRLRPAGTSPESSVRLDRQGRFWHDGQPVTHAGLERAFATWLRRHPVDGRYVLENGYDWIYLTVEDTPFFVSNVQAADPIGLDLNDGSHEALVPDNLRVDADGNLVTRVKGGAFEARFTRSAQLQLEPWLGEGPEGISFRKPSGEWIPLQPRG